MRLSRMTFKKGSEQVNDTQNRIKEPEKCSLKPRILKKQILNPKSSVRRMVTRSTNRPNSAEHS